MAENYDPEKIPIIQSVLRSLTNLEQNYMDECVFLKLFKLFSKTNKYKEIFYKWVLNDEEQVFPFNVNPCINSNNIKNIFDHLF